MSRAGLSIIQHQNHPDTSFSIHHGKGIVGVVLPPFQAEHPATITPHSLFSLEHLKCRMWVGILLRWFFPSHSDYMDGEAFTEELFVLLLGLFFKKKGFYELRATFPPSESSTNWSAWIQGQEIVLI